MAVSLVTGVIPVWPDRAAWTLTQVSKARLQLACPAPSALPVWRTSRKQVCGDVVHADSASTCSASMAIGSRPADRPHSGGKPSLCCRIPCDQANGNGSDGRQGWDHDAEKMAADVPSRQTYARWRGQRYMGQELHYQTPWSSKSCCWHS